MKKVLFTLLVAAVCVCLVNVSFGADDIAINASPSTVVLDGGDDGEYTITVHTDLGYDAAYTATVNGVTASTFSDDCGNLVARADIELDDSDIGTLDVVLVVSNGAGSLSGTDTITVKEDGKKSKPGTGPGPGGA